MPVESMRPDVIEVHRSAAPSRDPEPIVVGVDDEPASEPVIAFAIDEASRRHASLRVVHVWAVPADNLPAFSGADPATPVSARRAAVRRVTETIERWSARYPDVPVELAVRHSLDVPVALTAASRSAQLVVIGAARCGETGSALGPVGDVLVHRAGCPVAVVPRSQGDGDGDPNGVGA